MPAFLAAVRAGRAEVWLVMHNRGALGSTMTREQRFADVRIEAGRDDAHAHMFGAGVGSDFADGH